MFCASWPKGEHLFRHPRARSEWTRAGQDGRVQVHTISEGSGPGNASAPSPFEKIVPPPASEITECWIGVKLEAENSPLRLRQASGGPFRHSGEAPGEGLDEDVSWQERSRTSPERYCERSYSALTRCSIPRMVEHNGEAGESPALSRNCKLRRPPVRPATQVADGYTQQARSPAGLRGHLPSPQRR